MKFKDLAINDLINTEFDCKCGKTHIASIENIAIGEGAVEKLPEILASQTLHNGEKLSKGDKVYVIADLNTWEVAGEKVKTLVEESGYPVETYVLPYSSMHAEQKYADEIEDHMPEDAKLAIAVGSGTLNDLTRFVSFNNDIPYYIIATAPSMDGYASNVSPLVQNNLKKTHEAQCASAIIGDTNFLKTAPDVMVAAGLGDVLGKYLAVNDWKLGHLINDEYYCDEVGELVLESVRKCVENLPGLVNRETDALTYLMEALVLIGIAMSFIGYSRPASASEHHISHFMEMKSIQNGQYGELHGTCVGMATGLVGEMYKRLLEKGFDYEKALEHAHAFDYDQWTEEIERTYGPGAEEVIKLYQTVGQNNPQAVEVRIHNIKDNEEIIRNQIESVVAQTEDSAELLKALNGLTSPVEFDFDRETFKDILIYAKDLRNRYAALQLFYDLGELEDLSEDIVETYYA